MKLVRLMERGGSDYHDYKKALKMAKEAVDILCDITESMEDEFSSREGSHYSDGEVSEYRRMSRRSGGYR